jgi:hypothetical protein
MTGFVVIATMRRGALKRPEPLDDANQWRAFSAWRQDESREIRVEWELDALNDTRVVWAKKPGKRTALTHIDRMMELAGRRGI